jgi:hypothetical protein
MRVGQQIASATKYLLAFTGIASISSVVALAVSWGKLGFEISKTALVLGTSTDELMKFRSASQQFGISSDIAAASMKNLGDTMEDATYGRNQAALFMMKQLGLELHRTAGGAVDTHRAMMDLARIFQSPKWKGNVQAMGLAARMMGVEPVLPLLMQGPNAIQAMEAESVRTGATRDPTKAAAFGAILYRAQSAATGLANTIGDALIPVLTPLLEQFIQWEITNKDIIGTNIAQFVQDFADGVKKAIPEVNDFVKSLGGWKNVAIGLGVVMAINVLGPTIQLGKEIVVLTGLIYARLIPALIAMGAAGAASTSVIAGRFMMLGALGGLIGVVGGTAYGVASLLNDYFGWSEKIDDWFGADRANPTGAKPAPHKNMFPAGKGGKLPMPSKFDEAGMNNMFNSLIGPPKAIEHYGSPRELNERNANVHVTIIAPPGTTAHVEGAKSSTVHHALPSATLP